GQPVQDEHQRLGRFRFEVQTGGLGTERAELHICETVPWPFWQNALDRAQLSERTSCRATLTIIERGKIRLRADRRHSSHAISAAHPFVWWSSGYCLRLA